MCLNFNRLIKCSFVVGKVAQPAMALRFRFEVVAADLLLDSWPHFDMTFANDRLLIATSSKVIWVTLAGDQHGLVCERPHAEIINNYPGPPILRILGDQGFTFEKVDTETWSAAPVQTEIWTDEIPAMFAPRLDGTYVRYMTSRPRLDRCSLQGVHEVAKVPRASDIVCSSMAVGREGVFYNTRSAIYYWPFRQDQRAPILVAGHSHDRGIQDGLGRNARFVCMRRAKISNTHWVWVLDGHERLVRLDMRSDQVRTCEVRGAVDIADFYGLCPVDDELFAIDCHSNKFRLLRGIEESTTWLDVDLREKVRPVTFVLGAGQEELHFDARILRSRSDYFKNMFGSGWREAAEMKVDLRSAGVTRAGLEIVLRFLAGDGQVLTGAENGTLLEAYALADMYQVANLKSAAEELLRARVSDRNLLEFLPKVIADNMKQTFVFHFRCFCTTTFLT
jgi:hypothetical protein